MNIECKNIRGRNADLIEAALQWRKSWIDVQDLNEEKTGCQCEICQLIRACDEYINQKAETGG